jgi:hypothetical protein
MNLLVVVGLILGGWALLAKKSTATGATASVKVPTSTGTAAATVTLPKPTTITFPGTQTAATSTTPATTVTVDNTSATLNRDEQISIESDLSSDLYNKAMASQHLPYVMAAALRLSTEGNTDAADLTQRIANWKDKGTQ